MRINKILILIISLFSFFSLFNMGYIDSVKADTFHIVDWDGAVTGTSVGNTEYVTWHYGAGGKLGGYVVSNHAPKSQFQSFRINDTQSTYGTTWINFTSTMYLGNLTMWFDVYYGTGAYGNPQYTYFYFMNGTQYLNYFLLISDADYNTIAYYCGDSSGATLYATYQSVSIGYYKFFLYLTQITGNSFKMGLTGLTAPQTIHAEYGVGSSGQIYTGCTGLKIVSGGIYNNLYEYIDDINITTSVPEAPSGQGGIDYLSQFDSIGSNDDYGQHMRLTHRLLEIDYSININTTLKGVDLMVEPYQYEIINQFLSLYYLKVNGYNFSHPAYFFNLNGKYVLRWLFNLTVHNDPLVFEFVNMWKPIGSSYYWDIETGGGLNSIDWDNDAEFKHDNNLTYFDGLYNSRTIENEDLIYKFYYRGIHIINTTCGYQDFISGDSDTYRANTPISLLALLSVTYPVTYLDIWNRTDLHLVYHGALTDCSTQFDFSTDTCGLYRARLKRHGINLSTSYNFTVLPSGINWILCTPEPSFTGKSFTVYYNFSDTGYLASGKGLILGGFVLPLTYNNSEIQRFINVSQESGNFSLAFGSRYGEFALVLFRQIWHPLWQWQELYSVVDAITHVIVYKHGQYTNELHVSPSQFTINDGDYIYFRAYGHRTYLGRLGEMLHILANGNVIYTFPQYGDMGYPTYFSVNLSLDPSYYENGHIINISLVFKNPSVERTFDYKYLTVQFFNGNESQNPLEQIGFSISKPWSYFLGTGITITLFLLPFFLLQKVSSGVNSFIGSLLSMACGSIGLGLSTLLGLFPLWVMLAIIFIVILVIVMIWLAKKTG